MKTLTLLALFLTTTALASPGPRYDATAKKSGTYRAEGFFAGGSKEVTAVRLKDIRRANSDGFERVVFDLETSADAGTIPYFQAQLAPAENRLVLSIWSDTQYDFDLAKINRAFSNSPHIKKIQPHPRVEDGLTVVEMTLSGENRKFEAFYLTKPNRIIVDLQ